MGRVFHLSAFIWLSLLSSTAAINLGSGCTNDNDCAISAYQVKNPVCKNVSVTYSIFGTKGSGYRMECRCSKNSTCPTKDAVCEHVPVDNYFVDFGISTVYNIYGFKPECRCPSGSLQFPLSQPPYCLTLGYTDWFKHSVPQLGFMSELIEKLPAVIDSFMWTFLSVMKDGSKLCDWMSCSNRAAMCSDINVFKKLMAEPRVNKMNMTDLQTLVCKVLSTNLTQLYMDLTRDTRMVKDLFKMMMNMDTITHAELETVADSMKSFAIQATAFFADSKKFEDKLGLKLPQAEAFNKIFSSTGPFMMEFNKIVAKTFNDLNSNGLVVWLTSLGQCEQMRELVSKGHDSLRHAMFMMNKVLEFTSSTDIIGTFKKFPQTKKLMDMIDKLPQIVAGFGELALSNPKKMHDMLDKVVDVLLSDSKDMCTDTKFLDGYVTIEDGTKMHNILDLFCNDLVYGALWRELGLHKLMDEVKMWLMTPSYAYPVRFDPSKFAEDIRTFVGMFEPLGKIGLKRYIDPTWVNGTLWATAMAKVASYAQVWGNTSALQENVKKMLVYVRLAIPNTLTAEQKVAFLNVQDVVILVNELLKGLGGSLNYLSTVFANTVEMKKIVDLLTQELPTVFEKAVSVALDHVKLAKFTKALQTDDACVQSSNLHSVIGDNPLTQLVCGLDTAKLEKELAGLAANNKMVKALYQLLFQKYDSQPFDETAFIKELEQTVDLPGPVMALVSAIAAPQSPLKPWFNATVWTQAIGTIAGKATTACSGTDHVLDCVFRFVKASFPVIRWKMLNNVTAAIAAAVQEVDKFMIESVFKTADNLIQGIREPCVKRDCSTLKLRYDEPTDQWQLLKKSVPELAGQVRVVQGVPYVQVMYSSLVMDQPEFPSFKNITKWIKLSHYMRRMTLDSTDKMVAGYMDGSRTLGDCATDGITYSCGTPAQCVQAKPFVFYTERVDVFVDVVNTFDSSLLDKELFPHVQMCKLIRQSLLKSMQDSNLNAWIDNNCKIIKVNDNLVRVTFGGIFNKVGEQKIKEELNKMSSLTKFGEFQVKNISYSYSSEVCTSAKSIEPGKKDCAGVCNGDAVLNDCGLCVLGTTGRNMDFGKECGICRNSQNYGKDGYVRLDTCAKQCVGGSTGFSVTKFAYLRDCANICNGTRKNDTCGKCEKAITDTTRFPYGSHWRDCAGTCHPNYISLKGGAQNTSKTCYKCVGGKSSLKMSDVKDVCGVCGGNGSSCADCAGTPNGVKQKDACGACGGDGSTCTALASVSPLAVPAGVKQEFIVRGGGFDANSKCVFTSSSGPTEVAGTPDTKGKLKCEATLAAGVYELTVKFGSLYKSASDKSQTTILAYDTGIVYKRSNQIKEYTINCREKNTVSVEIEFAKETAPPVGCFVELENGGRLFVSGSAKNKWLTCSVPDVTRSGKARVYFTYADRKPVGSGLEYTIYCKAPTVLSVTLRNDCNLAIVSDLPIDRTNLQSCSQGIETDLGSNAECSFATQKVVNIANSILKPGDEVKFRANVIRYAGEKYSKAMPAKTVTVLGDSSPAMPVIKMRGSTTIAQCPGSKLVMTAQVSKGSICRSLQYTWSVSSTDDTNVTDIQAVLDGMKNEARVALDASLTSQEASYTFTVTVTNVFNKSSSAQHVAKADSGQTPIITSMVTDIENPKSSDRIKILAKIRKPSCATFGKVTFKWSSSPTRNGVALCKTRRCLLPKFSLPGGSTTTFTLTVEASGTTPIVKSLTVTVPSLPLVAVIQGLKKPLIGIDDGKKEFNGEESSDPNGYSDLMTYLWECSAIDDSDQYLASIALDSTTSIMAKLSLDPSIFIEGRYRLTLTVAKSAQGLSSSTSIIMTMVAGQPPQIVPLQRLRTGEVTVRAGKRPLVARFNIFSRSPVLLSGIVYSLDTGADYAAFDLSKVEVRKFVDKSSKNNPVKKYRYVLEVAKDAFQKGATYKIKLAVTNTANKSVEAAFTVKVRPGVTGCILQGATAVTELAKVELSVVSCKAGDESTLIYKLFVIDLVTRRPRSLSDSQTINTYTAVASLNMKQFFVLVIDGTGDFQMVFGGQLTITAKPSISDTEKKVFLSEIDDFVQVGDYSAAMSTLEPLAESLNSKGQSLRRRRAVPVAPPASTSSIPQKKLEVVAASHGAGSYDQSESLVMIDGLASIDLSSTSSSDQVSMITYLASYVAVIADGDGVDSDTYETVMELINRLRSYSGNSKAALDGVEKKLTKALSKKLDFGSPATVVTGANYTMTAAFRDLTSGMKSSASKPVSVNFGTELENKYTEWDCGDPFSNCFGVKVSLTQYDTSMDPRSTQQTDADNRVTDVMELVLTHPLTGEALVIANLVDKVAIQLPRSRTASSVGTVVCKFWDQATSAWSSQGVTTKEVNDTSVTCETTHLSTFAAIVEEPPTTQASPSTPATPESTASVKTTPAPSGLSTTTIIIVAAVSGGVVLLILIIIIVVCVITRKNKVDRSTTWTDSHAMVTNPGYHSAHSRTKNEQI